MKQLIIALFIAGALNGCSPSTEIVKSWQEPGAAILPDAITKTLVVALVKDETSRRVIEDQLVKRMGLSKRPAVASYTVINADALKEASIEKFSTQLKNDKFTHVFLVRLGDVEKETSYVQGTTTGYYGGYGRYYGYGAGMYSTPGYYQTDKNYFVESIVYSVDPDKLLYTSTTKTVNPSKLDKAVTEIADVVSDKMKRDGFIK